MVVVLVGSCGCCGGGSGQGWFVGGSWLGSGGSGGIVESVVVVVVVVCILVEVLSPENSCKSNTCHGCSSARSLRKLSRSRAAIPATFQERTLNVPRLSCPDSHARGLLLISSKNSPGLKLNGSPSTLSPTTRSVAFLPLGLLYTRIKLPSTEDRT